jgi:recombination protein RecT
MSKTKEVALKPTGTISSRFVQAIAKEFSSVIGDQAIKFNEKKKRLAQHLFISADSALLDLEKRRLDKGPKNNPPITWANVNMQKLSIDAMHRIELGLDALIPNHVSIIPYFNNRTKQYDIDLRIGYVGKDYYRRKIAINAPVDIRYELVYESDVFEVIKKTDKHSVETYNFEIIQPFKRGKIIGGFGYIMFKNPIENVLVLVSEDDFLKAKGYSKTDKFWGPHAERMRYKTLVIKTSDKLRIDPDKVNQSFAIVESDEMIERTPESQLEKTVQENANKEIIDIEPKQEPEKVPDPDPENDIPPNFEMSDEELEF